jgi:hypothetical protein
MIKKEHDFFEADNRTERHKMRSVQAGLNVGLRLTTSAGSSLLGKGRLGLILTEKISTYPYNFYRKSSKLLAVITAGDSHFHLYTWINIKMYSDGMMKWECVKWIHLAQTSSHEQGLVNGLC